MLPREQNAPARRLYFLDTMRYLMVLCVLIVHVAMAYTPLLDQIAYVPDAKYGSLSPVLVAIIESGPMEILFFIAGYFAIPSFRAHGLRGFLKSKCRLLLVPWIFAIVLQVPLLEYVYRVTRNMGGADLTFWKFWKGFMLLAATPYFGICEFKVHFFPGVFWFLTLLLAFFIVFGIWYRFRGEKTEGKARRLSIPAALLLCGVTAGAGFLAGHFVCDDLHFFSIGNILVFRTTRTAIYAAFFALGVHAYRDGWFREKPFPGAPWVHAVIGVVLLGLLSAVMMKLYVDKADTPLLHLAHGMARSFFSLALLSWYIAVLSRYANRFSVVSRRIAENSYNIYLIHYIVIVVFQLVMLPFPGVPGYAKFFIVLTLSTITSYAASNYIIKPYPKAFAASILFAFPVLLFLL